MRYPFAAFTLDTEQRTLLRQGQPIRLHPRVFETLAYGRSAYAEAITDLSKGLDVLSMLFSSTAIPG